MKRARRWIIAAGVLLVIGALAVVFWARRADDDVRPAARTPAVKPPEPIIPEASGPAPKGGAAVTGRVLAAEGLPLPAAAVAALDADGARTLRTSTAGADGAFRLDLDAGEHNLRAAAPGRIGAERRVVAPAAGVELVLHREAVIRGRVTGDPAEVAEARAHLLPVEVFPPEGALAATQARAVDVSDVASGDVRDGAFAFGELARGLYRVWADSPRAGSRRQEVELAAGGAAEVTLVLETGLQIGGRVQTPEGDPVEGATLHLAPAGYDRRLNEFPQRVPEKARSGRDGRFVIENVRPGRSYRLSARHPQRMEAVLDPVDPPAEVTLVMAPRGPSGKGRVSGRITARGSAVGGARVRWEALKAIERPKELWPATDRARPDRGIRSLPDGSYDFATEPGRYRVVVEADGFLPAAIDSVMVRDGDMAPGVDFALDPGASIRGRVVDDAETPVAGARVIVVDAGYRSYELKTGVDGGFAASGLYRDGPVRLQAGAPGYAAAEVMAAPDSAAVLRCARAGALRGAVLDAAGQPAARFHVRMEYQEGWAPRLLVLAEQARTFEDAAGRFEIRNVDPGRYRVTAIAFGDRPGPTVFVEVPPAAFGEVTLSIP